jgi:hypothetical protein
LLQLMQLGPPVVWVDHRLPCGQAWLLLNCL